MSTPNTISDLIDKWPTIGAFAEAAGCGYEAARQMRRRESIAPEHWPRVVNASKDAGVVGVTFEWLAQRRAAPASIATPFASAPGRDAA